MAACYEALRRLLLMRAWRGVPGFLLFTAVSALLPLDSRRNSAVRAALLRLHGARVGDGVFLCRQLQLFGGGGDRLAIGDGAFLNAGCRLDLRERVTIGPRVSLGPGVTVWTTTHDDGGPAQRAGPMRALPVEVGAGAWLGANVTVLPGARIGEGAVVAAGAVVASDVAPNTLVAGVPAKPVRDLQPG